MNADQFLSIASDYRLGELPTECPHPLSTDLSSLARSNLPQAISISKQIDLLALDALQHKLTSVECLAKAIQSTLANQRKIYLCGCGATGRLSLAIEVLCREGLLPPDEADRVIAFMAGGDTALIRSIENFEDHPEYGSRQLMELGFSEGDLLISSTEGGETPFVIGATEEAARHSTNPPWFLYCNPDNALKATVERSRRVIENPSIQKINLAVGSMTIAGSTRMQASTVLMEAIGLACMYHNHSSGLHQCAALFKQFYEQINLDFLTPFIECESTLYEQGHSVLYQTHSMGITVLTDTTERAPTFSLPVFENFDIPDQPASLCYLSLPASSQSEEAWLSLLKRKPRTFQWENLDAPTNYASLMGYDISHNALAKRKHKLGHAKQSIFSIEIENNHMLFTLEANQHAIPLKEQPPLFQHLLLKLILNIHSTLVMGKLGRFEGNLMTYVKPSNLKLIDRSIRYVQVLYKQKTQQTVDYERVTRVLFSLKESLKSDEPIVLKVLAELLESSTEL